MPQNPNQRTNRDKKNLLTYTNYRVYKRIPQKMMIKCVFVTKYMIFRGKKNKSYNNKCVGKPKRMLCNNLF